VIAAAGYRVIAVGPIGCANNVVPEHNRNIHPRADCLDIPCVSYCPRRYACPGRWASGRLTPPTVAHLAWNESGFAHTDRLLPGRITPKHQPFGGVQVIARCLETQTFSPIAASLAIAIRAAGRCRLSAGARFALAPAA
jgi:hypothetical protein